MGYVVNSNAGYAVTRSLRIKKLHRDGARYYIRNFFKRVYLTEENARFVY